MENLSECPLRVTGITYDKSRGILMRSYEVKADVDCPGLCNEGKGAKGEFTGGTAVVRGLMSLATAKEDARERISGFVQQELGCPYVEPVSVKHEL